jgi:uncharacterized protein YndB with AHSA1/START domain
MGDGSDRIAREDRGPGRLVLELACAVDAPRERVFGLLTQPAHLVRWWGPHGFTTPDARVDLRVGGGYRFTMQPPVGEAFHLSGDFVRIEPPTRLAYTFRWEEPDPDDRETLVELTLHEAGEATRLSLRQSGFATPARLALHRDGWSDSFERLRHLVGQGAGRPEHRRGTAGPQAGR